MLYKISLKIQSKMSVVSVVRKIKSTLSDLIKTKLPNDLKRMIYEDHFKEEIITEEYHRRIVKVLYCKLSIRLVTNHILARLIKKIFENPILKKKVLEDNNICRYFSFVVHNYENNITHYDFYRDDKYKDLAAFWLVNLHH